MSARILYVEKHVFNAQFPIPRQFVRVELRQWKDGEHRDTILEETVVVDGETVASRKDVLKPVPDAACIRFAIRTFDELVAAHPWANGEPTRKEVTR